MKTSTGLIPLLLLAALFVSFPAWVLRAAGDPDADDTSLDDIFNSVENVTAGSAEAVGVFIQDDYPRWGLDREASRTRFVIYERQRLRMALRDKTVWSEYLSLLPDEAVEQRHAARANQVIGERRFTAEDAPRLPCALTPRSRIPLTETKCLREVFFS